MPSHLTIRNVPSDLAKQLEREKNRHGSSMNQTVIDLLRRALGLAPGSDPDNGLGRHAGTWSDAALREFEAATASFEQVDPELWS